MEMAKSAAAKMPMITPAQASPPVKLEVEQPRYSSHSISQQWWPLPHDFAAHIWGMFGGHSTL